MWPFRRRERHAQPPAAATGPVHRAPRDDWKRLAPMPTVQARAFSTVDTRFEQRLTTRQPPVFLARLGHHVVPEAPHGRVAATPTPRTFAPAPPVQRQVLSYAPPVENPPLLDTPPAAAMSEPPAAGEPPAAVEPTPRATAATPTTGQSRRLVTAAGQTAGLPSTPFPVVSRRTEDSGPLEAPPSGDDAEVAGLVGEKPPLTSVPEPDTGASDAAGDAGSQPDATVSVSRRTFVAPPAGPAGATRAGVAPAAGSPPATPPPVPSAATARIGTPTPRIGPPIQRTTTASDSGAGAPSPRIGPAVQRTPATLSAGDARQTPAGGEPVTSGPAPERAVPTVESSSADALSLDAASQPVADVDVPSVPLLGERGWSEPPTVGLPTSEPGRRTVPVARAAESTPRPPAPRIGAPIPGPDPVAQRTVTWRPRVGDPIEPAPAVRANASPAASGAPGGPGIRPVVSRHAGHSHDGAEDPSEELYAVSRRHAGVPTAPTSPSVASRETISGIRWTDRSAPASPTRWTAAAIQREVIARSTLPGAAAPAARPAVGGREMTLGPGGTIVWRDIPLTADSASTDSAMTGGGANGSSGGGFAPAGGAGGSGVFDVVQRQADGPGEGSVASPPPSSTVTATAESGPAAPAPPAPSEGGGVPTEAQADEWARALYPALRRRLCRDLLLDRERSGYSTDIRF